MLLSTTAPLLEQLCGKVVCEIKDKNEKNDENEDKEIDIEKDVYEQPQNTLFRVICAEIISIQGSFLIKNDKLASELFSSLPKLPPEYA